MLFFPADFMYNKKDSLREKLSVLLTRILKTLSEVTEEKEVPE